MAAVPVDERTPGEGVGPLGGHFGGAEEVGARQWRTSSCCREKAHHCGHLMTLKQFMDQLHGPWDQLSRAFVRKRVVKFLNVKPCEVCF